MSNCRNTFDAKRKTLLTELRFLIRSKYNRPILTDEEVMELHEDLLNLVASFYGGDVSTFIMPGAVNEDFMDYVWDKSLDTLSMARKSITKKFPRETLSHKMQEQLFAKYLTDRSIDVNPVIDPDPEKTNEEFEEKKDAAEEDIIRVFIAPDGNQGVDTKEEAGLSYSMFEEDSDWHPVPRAGTSLAKLLNNELGEATDNKEIQDIQTYFQELVAKAYIDNDVQADGRAGRYRNPGRMVDAITRELKRNTYNLYKAQAGKVYVANTMSSILGDTRIIPKYEMIALEEDNIPQYMIFDRAVTNEAGEHIADIYVHQTLESDLGITPVPKPRVKGQKRLRKDSKAKYMSGVVVHNPEAFESALVMNNDFIPKKNRDETGYDEDIVSVKLLEVSDAVKDGLGGMSMEQLDKKARWSSIISKDIGAFMRDLYQPMYDKGEDNVRISYATDLGSVSQSDQESKMTKFLKATTPRITFEGWGIPVEQSATQPYLTPEDFDTVAQELSQLASIEDQRNFLEANMTEAASSDHHSIHSSIYFRFYAEEDYSMREYDPILGTHKARFVKKRSIWAMANIDDYDAMDEKTYFENEGDTLTEDFDNFTNENAVTADMFSAIAVSLASNSVYARYLSRYRVGKISNIEGGGIEERFYENILRTATTSQTKNVGGKLIEVPRLNHDLLKIYKRGKVFSKKEANGKITFYIKNVKSGSAQDVIEFTTRRNTTNVGVPLYLESINGKLTDTDRWNIFTMLGVHEEYLNRDIMSALKQEIEKLESGEDVKKINTTYAVDSLLINIVYLLSDTDSEGYLTTPITGVSEHALWGFKDAIVTALEPYEGSTSKKFTISNKNKKLSTRNPVNPLRRTNMLIKQAQGQKEDNYNYGSYLLGGADGADIIVDSINSQAGRKLSDSVKDSNQFTEREYLAYLMDEGYAQRGKATGWKSVMVRMGVMSDRKDIPLFNVRSVGRKVTSADGVEKEISAFNFFPVNKKTEKFDEKVAMNQLLKSQRNLHLGLERKIVSSWKKVLRNRFPDLDLDSITSLRDLDNFLKANPIPYSELKKNTSLVSNLMIIKQDKENDIARISPNLMNTIELFRSRHEQAIIENWRNYLSGKDGYEMATGDIYSIEDLTQRLKAIQIDYNEVFQDVRGDRIALEALGVISGQNNLAVINPSVIEEVQVLKDAAPIRKLIQISKQQFRNYVKESGYDAEQLRFGTASDILRKLTDGSPALTESNMEDAFSALQDAYFYSQVTLGDEIQRIQSGTSFQYKQGPVYTPGITSLQDLEETNIYDLSLAFNEDGSLNEEYIESVAKETITIYRDQIRQRNPNADIPNDSRLVWMERVLNSKNKFKAQTLIVEDQNTSDTLGWVDQSKRNAGPGSIGQAPSLISPTEIGAKLGKTGKYVLYEDPSVILKAVGVHADVAPTDIYDAVIMVHPASLIYYNNSMGNAESSYSSKGAPIKDVHTALTQGGAYIYNKRAIFNLFNHEYMSDATPELEDIFYKMNTAISYGPDGQGIKILVPEVDYNGKKIKGKEFDAPINIVQWTEQGAALGFVQYQGEIVHSKDLIFRLRRGDIDPKAFQQALEDGEVLTNRIEKTFKNYQEIWEHFGSTDNETSTEDTVSIVAFYAGGEYAGSNTDVLLLKANHPLRHAFMEMAGMGTAQKTGTQQIMPAEAFTHPQKGDSSFINMDEEGNQTGVRYFEMDNANRLIILQADHEPDTTRTVNKRMKTDSGHSVHNKDNDVALVTQLLSALVAEGRSIQEVEAVQQALGEISNMRVSAIKQQVINKAEMIAQRRVNKGLWSEAQMKDFMIWVTDPSNRPPTTARALIEYENENAEYLITLKEAYWAMHKKLIKDSLEQRSDSSAMEALVNISYNDFVEKFSFDLMQSLPLTQNIIYSTYNKAGVRFRFAGGQFVVSPSHHMMRTYKVGDAEGVTRSALNKIVYSGNIPQPKGELAEGVPSYELADITYEHLPYIMLGDFLEPKGGGIPMTKAEVKKRIRDDYEREAPEGVGFESYFNEQLIENYQSRLTELGAIEEGKGGEALRWQRYINRDGEDVLDSHQYEAFRHSNEILSSATKLEVQYGIFIDPETRSTGDMGSYYFSSASKTGPSELNKTMAKFYFFSSDNKHIPHFTPEDKSGRYGQNPLNEALDNLGYYWTPEQEEIFETWFKEIQDDPSKLVSAKNAVFEWLYSRELEHMEGITHLSNEDLFKVHLQEYLSDPSLNWYTEPAEFYMPSMHKENFLIKDEHVIHDFVGMQKQPKIGEMVKAGVFSPRPIGGSEFVESPLDQAKKIDRNYYKFDVDPEGNGRKLLIDTMASIEASDDPEKDRKLEVLQEYLEDKDAQMQHLRDFYEGRVEEWINEETDIFKFDSVEYNSDGSVKFVYTNKLRQELLDKRGRYIVGEDLFEVYNNLIKTLNEIEANPMKEDTKSARDMLTFNMAQVGKDNGGKPSVIEKFISTRALNLTQSFSQSLEFITARIPAQGKQSGIVGKVKAFVNSTRNSAYGPIELILITGGDYDIDKQNMMTWSVDSDGNIVDFREYMDDNDLIPTRRKLEERLINAEKMVDQRMDVDLDSLTEMQKTDHIKMVQIMKQQAADYEKGKFRKALQNFVVYNMIKSIGDPVNAIETNTMVAAETAKKLVPKSDYKEMKDSTFNTPAKALAARDKLVNKMSPDSMFRYNKINDDGNDSIGIFASDLKAYLVTTAAMLAGKFEAFSSFKSQFASMVKGNRTKEASAYIATNDLGKLDVLAVQFPVVEYDEKGNPQVVEVKNLKFLSNTEIHMRKDPKGTALEVPFSKHMAQVKYDIRNAETEEEQVNLILEHSNNLTAFDTMTAAPQAWAALSELLTAATDNAKLLILGKIGANNTTNSIISTMIRAGVPLDEAVGLIQEIENHPHPDVKSIFKRMQDFRDTQVNQLEEKTFSSIIKALNDTMKSLGVSYEDSDISTLLTHPLARLYPFAKMTEEFNLVSKAASINQGMKVPIYDSWRYIKGLEGGFNRLATEWNLEQRKEGSDVQFIFELERFITEASEGKTGSDTYVSNTIELFDRFKTGVNVPFVLKQSPQFFNYFKAMFTAKQELNKISYTYQILDNLLTNIFEKENHLNEYAFDDRAQRDVLNYVYGIGVDLYYNVDKLYEQDAKLPLEKQRYPVEKQVDNQKSKFLTFNINLFDSEKAEYYSVTKSYDLSLPSSSDPDIGGRLEFIKDFPAIKSYYSSTDKLRDNQFLATLKKGEPVVDYESQIQLDILEISNVAALSDHLVLQYKRDLEEISRQAPELYNALFQYSLITNRGKYAGGSFASLMDERVYLDYSHFLKNHILDIKMIAEDPDNYDMLLMNAPAIINGRSTNKSLNERLRSERQSNKGYAEENLWGDFSEHFIEEGMGEGDPGMMDNDFLVVGRPDPSLKQKEMFYLSYLNEQKRLDISRAKSNDAVAQMGDYIKSKETGLVYKWNSELSTYVPIQQKLPRAALPINVLQKANTKAKRGATEGFDIDHKGKTMLTVYAYIDNEYAKEIASGKITSLAMHKNKDFKGKEYYIVSSKGNNNYTVMDIETLQQEYIVPFESALIVDGPKMVRERRRGERTITKRKYSIFWKDKKNNALYAIKPTDKEVKEIIIDAVETLRIDSTSSTIYDTIFFKKLFEALSTSSKRTNFNRLDLDISYNALRDQVMLDYLTELLDGSDVAATIALRNRGAGDFGDSYDAALSVVNQIFPASVNPVEKLILLQNAQRLIKEELDPKIKWDISNVVIPTKGEVTNAHLDMIVNPNIIKNISLETFHKFLLTLPGEGATFGEYRKQVLFSKEHDYRVYVEEDTQRVFLADKFKTYIRDSKLGYSEVDLKALWKELFIPGAKFKLNYVPHTVTQVFNATEDKAQRIKTTYFNDDGNKKTSEFTEKDLKSSLQVSGAKFDVLSSNHLGVMNTINTKGSELESDTVEYEVTATRGHKKNPDIEKRTITLNATDRVTGISKRVNFTMENLMKNVNAGTLRMKGNDLTEELPPGIKAQWVMVPENVRQENLKKVSKDFIFAFARRVSKLVPNIEIRILNSKQIEAEYGIKKAHKLRGFVAKDTVVFNEDVISLDTPIHEFAHIYFEHLKWDNNELYNKLVQEALKSSLAEEMRPYYKGMVPAEEDFGEDVLVEMIARKFSNELAQEDAYDRISVELSDKSLFSKVIDYLERLFHKVFSIDSKKFKLRPEDSFSTVLDKVGSRIVYGKTSILSDFSLTTEQLVRMGRKGASMNMIEARKLLVDYGYIVYRCS